VAAARRLHRRTERTTTRTFLVEGPRAVSEALANHTRTGADVRELFLTAGANDRHPELLVEAARLGLTVHTVADNVAAALASTRTPQGVVAVCGIPRRELADALTARAQLVAVLVDVADPGNAGTAIRTADAAGADCVILTGTAVDPYNGKCVRASAGSLFHIPVISGVSATAAVDALHKAGLVVRAADAHGELDLDDLEETGQLASPTAWLFGNEAHGLDDATSGQADERVRVPIHGRAESLNLAAAVAVCLFCSARSQRRASPSKH
jgi:TrmH family RNA methyltransferase